MLLFSSRLDLRDSRIAALSSAVEGIRFCVYARLRWCEVCEEKRFVRDGYHQIRSLCESIGRPRRDTRLMGPMTG